MAFGCTVLTPEQQVLDEQITQAIVPAHDGQVGILTNRAPLMTRLGTGQLRLDLPNGQKRVYFIDGGIAQMKENRLTILTGEAIAQSDIDAETARAELAEAAAVQPTDELSARQRQHRMERARAMQQMAGK
jgi:F-type H+-transporting ATPase subunit epsilon